MAAKPSIAMASGAWGSSPRGVCLGVLSLCFACSEVSPPGEPQLVESSHTPRDLPRLRQALTPPPPITGGSMEITADGALAVVADPDRDQISLVDLKSGEAVKTFEVEAAEPGRVALSSDGAKAWVVLRRAGQLATIDLQARSLSREAVCAAPRSVAEHPEQGLLMACAGGEVLRLDARGQVRDRTYVDTDLRDLLVSGSSIFVTRFRSAELLSLNEDLQVTRRWQPRGQNSRQGGRVVPRVAWRARLTPEGRVVMIHQLHRETPVVINVHTPHNDGEVDSEGRRLRKETESRSSPGYGSPPPSNDAQAQDLGCNGGLVHAAVSCFDDEGVASTFVVPGAVLAVDLSLRPRGDTDADTEVILAVPGNEEDTVVSTFALRAGPFDDCAEVEVDEQGAQPVAVAVAPDGELFTLDRRFGELHGSALGTVELDAQERDVFDSGHDLFHVNTGAGIACAGCHPEGRDDGHTWDFTTLGLRRTQNLALGGIRGTEPFHWNGDMPEFVDLVGEVFSRRMGGPRVKGKHVTAFLDWVDQIPALEVESHRSAEQVARGKALFEDAEVGCTECHSGDRLSNNQSYFVGTGFELQVPTLLGIAHRAPYMHNGCAQTLAERFDPECGGGNEHGVTSTLDASQLDDLVAYMETL